MTHFSVQYLTRICCFISLATGALSQAESSIEGIDFAATVKVKDVELKLNGLGLRKIEKYGLPFKVYVGGLYLEEKRSEAADILNSNKPRVLRMVFVRRVDGKDLAEAFAKGFKANCEKTCEETNKSLHELTDKLPDVLVKSSMEFTFFVDRLEYVIHGRKDESGTINGAAFAPNFLALFIGQNPPTEAFKKGLLGIPLEG